MAFEIVVTRPSPGRLAVISSGWNAIESIWNGIKHASTRPYTTIWSIISSVAPTQRHIVGIRMNSAADRIRPTAVSTAIDMLSSWLARSFFPSPSSLEIRALAPVPNISPTYITISNTGKIRFSASKASSLIKLDIKYPSAIW